MPRVSILVTTYNRSKILPRALQSILKQTYRDYEIIIVDDCSQDDTADVVKTFDDPRIRYIRNPQNVAGTLGDRTIAKAFIDTYMQGEFFIWLCDDDFWIPDDLLLRHIQIMDDYPSIALVAVIRRHKKCRVLAFL